MPLHLLRKFSELLTNFPDYCSIPYHNILQRINILIGSQRKQEKASDSPTYAPS